MAKKNTKATVKRILEMALAFGIGSVFVVPMVIFIKSKLGV